MASTDAAFLTEVESFLNLLELPPPSPVAAHCRPAAIERGPIAAAAHRHRTTNSNNNSNATHTHTHNSTSTRNAPRESAKSVVTSTPDASPLAASTDNATVTLRRLKERTRRQSYRERQLLERAQMSREIARLTAEVHRVRTRQQLVRAWKALAQRQLSARQTVEAEQQRLCRAVLAQAQLLSHVQSFLQPPSGPPVADATGAACFHQTRVRLSFVNADVFRTFLRELDDAYAMTDTVLQTWGLASTAANWDAPSEVSDKEAAFRFKSKLTMPFSFDAICRSRWLVSRFGHRQDARELHKTGGVDPENTLAVKFRVKTRLHSGTVATAVQRLIIRRYVEAERMVIVWRLFTEGEGVFTGLSSDEAGWCVATPVRSAAREGTVIRTCVNNKAMPTGDDVAAEPVVTKFRNQLLEWGLENNEEVTTGLQKTIVR
ncbi:unnamed protein product [Hyaloperonospora brassicae]|uniref:BZIP domain-containing protein n=1 Tax=Hyaloperonospora brassicae TaxID=162125 RepID=A0AAV0UVP4_HYABA|nr:unnamed protein product [Hyaloperonospora brassicae]